MTLRFRKYSWQLAPQAVRDIRHQVFIEEQKVPEDLEWDDTDAIADHYVAVDQDNTAVAVARLYPSVTDTARIGRMAVLPSHRGRGVGEALLRHLVTEAAGDFNDIALSAQERAIPFYQRSGFHVCSDPYDDAGIPHVDMRCLAPSLVASQWQQRDQPMILGQDRDAWLFDSDSDLRDLMDSVCGQARQRLWLYDRLLEHGHYDRFRLREIISGLARRHRLSEVRLLIHDDKPLVQRRHQLVELMRRLPSKIELRLVNPDYPNQEQPFLLADRDALVMRHRFESPAGVARFAEPGHVKRMAEDFQRMWDTASPSLELRELPL
ncbi:MAG: GNAT family N-acetyltransferase [Marinobacter sp.]|uniref:GNAT family N-acetyltransferase n=1 Tax=Marinobacter sp. TaxID=50741 RepID=UPI00299E9CF9|nr:GNAT family N-acetyltransferase [Marinobacter sp.]MDX1633013.1 GNAT family N-acetyltransferase [Marinobacter sp.]